MGCAMDLTGGWQLRQQLLLRRLRRVAFAAIAKSNGLLPIAETQEMGLNMVGN